MKLDIDQNFCWRASLDGARVGCTLDPEALAREGLELRSLKQVHGSAIHDDDAYAGPDQEGDGLVTDRTGTAVAVKTADCVPVAVTDGARVAVAHAGWRGLKAGVLKRLADFFDLAKAHAFIGPAISQANYEVDEDLYRDWVVEDPSLEASLFRFIPDSGKRLFDLKGFARDQLTALGVPEQQLIMIPICTYDAGALPSYRRDGDQPARIWNYAYRV